VSDIKLFRLDGAQVEELPSSSVAVEKSLQTLIERHLETFLGVRFMASEYSTGKSHSGRIDTLGIDENNCPVIIEYKRSTNENVINQGLFYLDWLLDHRAEFTLLAMRSLGPEIESAIDWSAPRLICIAGDFTRYDEHAVQQINRNIELFRYRDYDGKFLVLELANATTGAIARDDDAERRRAAPRGQQRTVTQYYETAPDHLRDLFDALEAYLMALGDDVTRKTLEYYFAFRRIKNFACVEIHPQNQTLLIYVKVDPDSVELEDGFTRDVRAIGHFGTGDLEIRVKAAGDLERAKPLLLRSYEVS
jgi:predicted transport protein